MTERIEVSLGRNPLHLIVNIKKGDTGHWGVGSAGKRLALQA